MSWFRRSKAPDPAKSTSASSTQGHQPSKNTGVHRSGAHNSPLFASTHASSSSHASSKTGSSLELVQLRTDFFDFELLDSAQDKINQLPKILSRFCHVFGNAVPAAMVSDFGREAFQSLSSTAASTLVAQIRDKASDQSTEDASVALAEFLCDGLGKLLLETASLLVQAGKDGLDSMCAASLPSTLAKALYIFFDLPPAVNGRQEAEIQRMHQRFSSVLDKLLRSPQAPRELLVDNDIDRLFDLLAWPCPEHNLAWHQTVCKVLRSVFEHSLDRSLLDHVTKAGLLPRALGGVVNPPNPLHPKQVANSIACVAECLKLSCVLKSPMLLDSFRQACGYAEIGRCILLHEKKWLENHAEDLQTAVEALAALCFAGYLDLRFSKPQDPLQNRSFRYPTPSGTNKSIRNVVAFHALKTVFNKAQTSRLKTMALDAIFDVLTRDQVNYFIAQPEQTLTKLLEAVPTLEAEQRHRVYKLLEFVVCTLDYVPSEEFAVVQQHIKSEPVLAKLALNAIIKFVNFDQRFAALCGSLGVVDVLISKLLDTAKTLKEGGTSTVSPLLATPTQQDEAFADTTGGSAQEPDDHSLLMEALALVLNNNKANAETFRAAGGARAVYNMLFLTTQRAPALRLVQHLILGGDSAASHDDLGTLLELLQTSHPSAYGVKIDILRTLSRLFSIEPRVASMFRSVHGFVYVVSTLLSLVDDSTPATDEIAMRRMQLLDSVFETLTLALRGNPLNKETFASDVRYESFTDTLLHCGMVSLTSDIDQCIHVFKLLFMMAGECPALDYTDNMSTYRILVPELVPIVVTISKSSPADAQEWLLSKLLQYAEAADANAQQMAVAGLVGRLVEHFGSAIMNPDSRFYLCITKLVAIVGQHGLGPDELRSLLRLTMSGPPVPTGLSPQPLHVTSPFIRLLEEILVKNESAAQQNAFFEFDLQQHGYASLLVPSLCRLQRHASSQGASQGAGGIAVRHWPPTTGLSISMFVRVERWGLDDHPVRLARFFLPTEQEHTLFELYIDAAGRLCAETEELAVFDEFRPKQSVWHHILLVFQRKQKIKLSALTLFVDGKKAETVRLAYPTHLPQNIALNDINSQVFLRVGTAHRQRNVSPLLWRMACMHVFDDLLTEKHAAVLASLGPGYSGSLQGSLDAYNPWPCGDMASEDGASEDILNKLVNLKHVHTPMVAEDRVWLSLQARPVLSVEVEDALKVVGGRPAASALARSVELRDSGSIIPSVANACPSLLPPYSHLSGAARVFTLTTPAGATEPIGGIAVLFKLMSDVTSIEQLDMLVRILVVLIKQSPRHAQAMLQRDGYQIVLGLLLAKMEILSVEVLDQLFQLCCLEPTSQPAVASVTAFRDLFLQQLTWVQQPERLRRHLLQLFQRMLHPSNPAAMHNAAVCHHLHLMSTCLDTLHYAGVSSAVQFDTVDVLQQLVLVQLHGKDLKLILEFMDSTVKRHFDELGPGDETSTGSESTTIRRLVFHLLLKLLESPASLEKVDRAIAKRGATWVFKFLAGSVDDESVMLATRFTFGLLQAKGAFTSLFNQQVAEQLAQLLSKHSQVDEVYILTLCLILGYPIEEVPLKASLNLHNLKELFDFGPTADVNICHPSLLSVLFGLLQQLFQVDFHTKCDEHSEDTTGYDPSSQEELLSPEAPVPPPRRRKPVPKLELDQDQPTSAEVSSVSASSKNPFGVPSKSPPKEDRPPSPNKKAPNPFVQPKPGAEASSGKNPFLTAVSDADAVSSPDSTPPFMSESPSRRLSKENVFNAAASGPGHVSKAYALTTFLRHLWSKSSSLRRELCKAYHIEQLVLCCVVQDLDKQPALHLTHPCADSVVNLIADALAESMTAAQTAPGPAMSPAQVPQIDIALTAVSQAPPLDRQRFRLRLLKAILAPPLHERSFAQPLPDGCGLLKSIPLTFSAVAEYLPVAGASTKECVDIVPTVVELARQVADPDGMPLKTAITLFGEQVVTDLVAMAHRSLCRFYINSIVPNGTDLAPSSELVDTLGSLKAHMSFVAGSGNKQDALVLSLCHCLLQTSSHADPAVRDMSNACLLRMFIFRSHHLSSVISSFYDPARLTKELLPGFVQRNRQKLTEACSKAFATTQAIWEASERQFRRTKKKPAVPIEQQVWMQEAVKQVAEASKAVRIRMSKRQHRRLESARFVAAEWQRLEADLHRERGLFGSDQPNPLEKWMLDTVEGPSRMRKKLRPNPSFYLDYPYRPELSLDNQGPEDSKSKLAPTSLDSKEFHEKYVRNQANEREGASSDVFVPDTEADESFVGGTSNPTSSTEEDEPAASDGDGDQQRTSSTSSADTASSLDTSQSSDTLSKRHQLLAMRGSSGGSITNHLLMQAASANLADDTASEGAAQSPIFRLLEAGDTVKSDYSAWLVSGMDAYEGVLFLCGTNLYFVEGFSRSKQGTIRPLHPDQRFLDAAEPVMKWCYEDVRDIRKGRFLLQNRAMEIFSTDGNNTLLAFVDTHARDSVYGFLSSTAPRLVASAEESVSGMHRDAKVEQVGFLATLTSGRTVTQRWEAGELTNFQYIMYLNTLAGRSYNDLNQYPVFPWVLRDYTSEELDLSSPATFRDLGKPMGAQTPERAAMFRHRYDSWPNTDEPPFHYGTHYSSAAGVAFYLVRLEPFTKHYTQLQGGHFDHPDRMFHSIEEAWRSASEKNAADVKELIPEFFYLPEFLENRNNFVLGTKHSGEELDDVILPPWAKGSAREFVRIHREALECDYVSAHLHEWIDLVFGYKQQGPEAVAAQNVFHHLTYEGAVDIEAIEDPLERRATISIINNFGQTPKQLFKRPHPAKRIASRKSNPTLSSARDLSSLVAPAKPLKSINAPVGHIVAGERLVVVSVGQLPLLPSYSRCLDWNSPDGRVVSFALDSERDITVFEQLHIGPTTCAVNPGRRLLVTGGSDTTVRVWTPSGHRGKTRRLVLKQTLCGHTGAVTCLAACIQFSMLVSGSTDESCIIWDLNRLRFVRQLPDLGGPVSAIGFSQQSGNFAVGALSTLSVFSINGDLLATTRSPGGLSSRIMSCAVTNISEWAADDVIATGHEDGKIRLWGMSMAARAEASDSGSIASTSSSNLKRSVSESAFEPRLFLCGMLPQKAKAGACQLGAVTAMAISADQSKLFTGDSHGHVFSWTLPDVAGRSNDHWVRDSVAEHCMAPGCKTKFSFTERRHHCRRCGKVFCGKCSAYEASLPELGLDRPVRVCVTCYGELSSNLDDSSVA